jgi:uncharacterized protein YkwD
MKTNNSKNNLIILSTIWTLLFLGVSFAKADEKLTAKQIINYANQERVKEGLEQLTESEVLNRVAGLKAKDMLGNDYFAHTSPAGIDPWHWFEKVGYEYRFAGENLGMDFKTAIAVHEAWMKSESHKENILSNKYKEIGVVVETGIINNKETQIAVQIFGSSLRNEDVLMSIKDEKDVSEKSEIEITQSSLHFWKGEKEDEVLISAEVKGDPGEVIVIIDDEEYPLEKLRENVYVNLVSLEDITIEKNVLIKAFGENDLVIFDKVPDKYLAEYLMEKEDEGDENQMLAMLSSRPNNNQFLEKARNWFGQTGVMLLVIGLLVITILNIWILEREEERLLKIKNA